MGEYKRRKTTQDSAKGQVVARIVTMVTPDEKKLWKKAAIADGRSISSFVRLLVNQKISKK